jgi:hypothetical protein
MPRDIETMSRILQDLQVLGFQCLGGDQPRIDARESAVSLAGILHHLVMTSFTKLSIVMKSNTPIHPNRIFMHSLLETRLSLSQVLGLYRFNRKLQLPEAIFENEIMPDLIDPGLLNRSHRCDINAFVQTLFHILPLRLMILAWPNDDPIVSKLRLLFAQMSGREVTSAASLSRICEPH